MSVAFNLNTQPIAFALIESNPETEKSCGGHLWRGHPTRAQLCIYPCPSVFIRGLVVFSRRAAVTESAMEISRMAATTSSETLVEISI